MQIDSVILRHVSLPLLRPFETSFGTRTQREVILVEARSGLYSGWGESPVLSAPVHNEETIDGAWHLLADYLVPLCLEQRWEHPSQLAGTLESVRRNYMAKAGLEGAIWDLYAREQRRPLSQVLGGVRTRIPVGVSLGLVPDLEDMLGQVEGFLSQGYQRIKIGIEPGWDREPLSAIRKRFGNIQLTADANCAYTLEDMDHLRSLDAFRLNLLEQPLAHNDIVDHAQLQAHLRTPICLDESIHSVEEARKALDLRSCRAINVKVARVGGLTSALALHDLCLERGVPLLAGGLMETGVGRAHTIALASLEGFTLPGDTSASSRYWERDVINPEVKVDLTGHIMVPTSPGLGFAPRMEVISGHTLREAVLP